MSNTSVLRSIANNLIVNPSSLAGLPGVSLVGESALRNNTIGLNGVVKDETPGRGTDRLEEPGRCLDFDGASEAALGSLAFATSDRTLSTWICTTDAPNPGYIISSRSGNAGGLSVVLNTDGTIGIRVAATTKTSGTRVVNDGNWHLITVVYTSSNDTISIYVDGSLDIAYVSGTTQVEQVWEIASYDGATFRYTGKLSDLQIFDSALTATEVHQLYTIGLNTDRLVWLKLEEGSGDYCYDSSGNNNTATLSGHTSAVRYTGSDVLTSSLNKVGYSTYAYFAGTDSGRIQISAADAIASNAQGSVSVFAAMDEAFNGSTLDAILDVSGTGITGLGIWSNLNGVAKFSYGNGALVQLSVTTTPHKRHHYGVTWNGSTIKFFLDGVLVHTRTDATLSLVAPLKYLGGNSTNGRNHKGTIEDFRTYATTLSDTDMAKLASGESITADPHYHIPLNERSGNVFNEVVNGTTFTMTADHSWRKYGRNEANKAQDLLTGPLQYTGEAPKNGQLENSYCRDFDGVDDEINLVSPTAITGTSYTYLTWLRLNSGTVSVAGRSDIAGSYALVAADDVLYHKPNNSGSNFASVSGLIAAMGGMAGSWQPVVVRRNGDGNDVDFFVGGVKYAASYTGTISNEPCTVNVIGHNNGGVYFNGSLAGFGCVDRALTDEECIAFGQGVLPDGMTDFLPLSDSHQDSAVNVVNPANSGTASGHNSSFVGRQNVFAYNAAKGSSLVENLWKQSEPSANPGLSSGVTFEATTGNLASFGSHCIRNPASGSIAYAYETSKAVEARAYRLECHIEMDDGSQPVMATDGNHAGGDFAWVLNNAFVGDNQRTISLEYENVLGNVWKVTLVAFLPTGGTATAGFIQYAGNSGKAFRATALRLAEDISGESRYTKTTGTIIPLQRTPAASDGLGADVGTKQALRTLTYAPSPGVWPLSENTFNSNPNNAPRRDWSLPVNLVEHDLTNWSLQAQTLDRGILGPDGNFTAFRINNLHQTDSDLGVSRTISSGIAGGAPYAGSFWIKGEGSNIGKNVSLRLKRGAGAGPLALQDTDFELSGEWQLASHFLTLDSANTHMITGISGAASSNKASSVLIWNPQLEAGSVAGPSMPYGYDPNEPSDFTPNPPNLTSLDDLTLQNLGSTTGQAGPEGTAWLVYPLTTGAYRAIRDPGVFNTKTYECRIKAKASGIPYFNFLDPSGAGIAVAFNLTTGVKYVYNNSVYSEMNALDDDWYELILRSKENSYFYFVLSDNVGTGVTANGTDGVLISDPEWERYHPTNPNNFFRQRTDAGKLVGIDRLTNYKQPILGTRLSQVQKFITAKVL